MIGVVTFTDPRPTALSEEREEAIKQKHNSLIKELSNEFEVLDINAELGKYEGEVFGINSIEEAIKAGRIAKSKGISGVILGLWHWTESNLVTYFLKEANLPVLLYSDGDPAWAGATCVTSVGASLWESSVNEHALRHSRIIGDVELVKSWARAVEAVSELSKKRLLLFGSPYTLGMEHLMDDLPRLKRFIGDFIMLDQYVILHEDVSEEDVERFYGWLLEKMKVKFDEKMLTPDSLKRQIRIYLGAKKVWERYKDEVAGISIKCQPELSEIYGTTACLIPAFFPFNADAFGEKPIVPATCEGDIKGTISSSLLYYLSGKPPLFGDIKYVDDEIIIIANCGASSLYYARLSDDPEENLRAVTVQGQCQGKSGGALTYRTPPAEFTVTRLIRRNGEYYLLYFLTEGVEITEEIEKKLKWGKQWPHTAIKNPLDAQEFISVMGANHLSLIPGDYTEELKFAAKIWGIKAVDLNDPLDVREFLL
ncbi:L-fucose/L-arabinose isomerase family protein [Pyrococcus kukulkanii]|uniref:Fucose isomerase n=1 Tax=Pyrococcus kukulkanii TaxID=1609559 RepID=A0A127BBU5_9EURY|nr:L-fucose/L-arabinose isomerase family protein [Pyrococcus kukulkanii]AMM54792.1 fucose isomerase [Pyrococcus kukulkanii]